MPWSVRARLRARSLTGRSRGLAIVIACLVVAGPALAAAGVFSTGSTVPPAHRQSATTGDGLALRSGVEVTALRVADPDGGPTWGLRLTRTTRGELCPVVGRVVSGRVGVLGIDGAFHNDGLFHPYAANYPNYTFDGIGCAPTDAQGYGFVYDTSFGASASASLRAVPCRARWIEPAVFKTIRRRLHPRRRQTLPVCRGDEVRDIYFGLLGPDVTAIAYRAANGEIRTERTAGSDGAYLVVLPHNPHNEPSTGGGSAPGSPIRGIALRSGEGCGVLGPQSRQRPLSDCTFKDFTAPDIHAPTEAEVRSPLTVRSISDRPGESVSFIARVGVDSTRSYYAISVTDPPHRDPGLPRDVSCAGGNTGGSERDIRAGQRLTLTSGAGGQCYGRARAVVEYVIYRGPYSGPPIAVPPPRTTAARHEYTVRIVGRFSFRIPRHKFAMRAHDDEQHHATIK